MFKPQQFGEREHHALSHGNKPLYGTRTCGMRPKNLPAVFWHAYRTHVHRTVGLTMALEDMFELQQLGGLKHRAL